MELTVSNEPKIRWNIKQTSKGAEYYEYTVRGDSIDEVKKLAEQCRTELRLITGQDQKPAETPAVKH